MKLKDILKEAPNKDHQELLKWLNEYVTRVNHRPIDEYDDEVKPFVIENGWLKIYKANGEYATRIDFASPIMKTEFNPPLKGLKWAGSLDEIRVDDMKIVDWSLVPNTQYCALYDIIGPGFRGIEKLDNIEFLDIGFSSKSKLESLGLLSILKLPKLKELYSANADHDDDRDKALNILIKAVKSGNKDIAEVSEELIDAGLEDYARL